MSKRTLALGSAILGLALVAGATTRATAADQTDIPSDTVHCYYKLWHCTYGDDSYWSGCEPRYGEGWYPTGTVKAICTTYHRP